MTPKELVLEALLPYMINPSLCAYEDGGCKYITTNGKMCVAGKYMLHPELYHRRIGKIFESKTQAEIFKPEVVGILTNSQWSDIQYIHDYIAGGGRGYGLIRELKMLDLFTEEEIHEIKIKINIDE